MNKREAKKRWKIFSTKIAGNFFPVENIFHRADEFSLNENGAARFFSESSGNHYAGERRRLSKPGSRRGKEGSIFVQL